MSPTRVTVVIPCWNPDPVMLAEAVTSALGQTHADLEVILADDGSPNRLPWRRWIVGERARPR